MIFIKPIVAKCFNIALVILQKVHINSLQIIFYYSILKECSFNSVSTNVSRNDVK
jgi:hypothetical protein